MNTPPANPRLTAKEVAGLLGVDVAKVLIWIHAGELRAVDVATRQAIKPRWRIALSDLERFEASRATRGIAPAPRTTRAAKHDDIPQYV